MATAKNAMVMYESGRILVDYEAITNSGDNKIFNPTNTLMSRKSGYEPDIKPNGIAGGRALITPTTNNDEVSIEGFTAYIGGKLYSFNTATLTITRGSINDFVVNSIVAYLNSGTPELKVIAGSEGTSFSEARGVAGSAPYIGVDEIEVGQVRVNSQTSAVLDPTEIFQVIGQHQERYDFPVFSYNAVGEGTYSKQASKANAYVEFANSLPKIHTGDTTKKVYVKYYVPIFGEIPKAMNWTPIEKSHSVTSTEYYNGAIASSSSSIGQGSFTALLDDGITDSIVADKNDYLTFKFFPDRNKPAYQISQGLVGIERTFPVDNQIQATVTISGEYPTAEFAE